MHFLYRIHRRKSIQGILKTKLAKTHARENHLYQALPLLLIRPLSVLRIYEISLGEGP